MTPDAISLIDIAKLLHRLANRVQNPFPLRPATRGVILQLRIDLAVLANRSQHTGKARATRLREGEGDRTALSCFQTNCVGLVNPSVWTGQSSEFNRSIGFLTDFSRASMSAIRRFSHIRNSAWMAAIGRYAELCITNSVYLSRFSSSLRSDLGGATDKRYSLDDEQKTQNLLIASAFEQT